MVTELVSKILEVLRKLFPSPGESYNSADFIYSFGKASDAILYSLLFMPELVIISNSVLLTSAVSDSENKKKFLSALLKNNSNLSELEASFNFIELGYLFNPAGRDTDDDQDLLLAKLIAISWRRHLVDEYPERRFVVEVLTSDITGSTVGVHFYEKR